MVTSKRKIHVLEWFRIFFMAFIYYSAEVLNRISEYQWNEKYYGMHLMHLHSAEGRNASQLCFSKQKCVVVCVFVGSRRPSFSNHLYCVRYFIHKWWDLQFNQNYQKFVERKLSKKYFSLYFVSTPDLGYEPELYV